MSKRTALIASGAVLTAAGAAAATGGVALALFAGTDGTVSTGHHGVTSATTALVSADGDIDGGDTGPFDAPTLSVSVEDSDKPVFVGIGPTEDVDRFLSGAAVETVTDFELWPFDLDTDIRDGTRSPGSPLDETFWVAQSDGATSAATSWRIDNGSYRVVVMNADGSAGVDVHADVSVEVPVLRAITLAGLAGGTVLLVIGLPLLVAGLQTKETPPAPPAPVEQELTPVA
jgi:hypothetical protein